MVALRGGLGEPPDPTGTQLKAIRNYLLAHLDIEWVWFECVSCFVLKLFPSTPSLLAPQLPMLTVVAPLYRSSLQLREHATGRAVSC